jgi:hypothetical protein
LFSILPFHIGPISAAEGSPDAHPDPLVQSISPSENETEDVINPLAAPFPGNPYRSSELNTLDSDAPPASAHPDPQLENSGHEPVFILVIHEDDGIPYSQPDSPTILHHPEASTEGARTINDLPLPHARPSSNEPDETHPSDDNHTAAGAAPVSTPQPPTSLSVADPDGVVPQQAAGNETTLSDAMDLHQRARSTWMRRH